jgi:hypothetical protein
MVVSPQDPLPRVLRQLATEGFLSAPVLEGTKYVGFIDVSMIVRAKQLFPSARLALAFSSHNSPSNSSCFTLFALIGRRGTSPICSGSVCFVCSVCSGFTDVLLEKADTEEEWVDFWEKYHCLFKNVAKISLHIYTYRSDDFGSTKVEDVMKKPDEWQRDPYPPTLEGYSTFHALE